MGGLISLRRLIQSSCNTLLSLCERELQLLSQRAAFLPESRTLLVADLHLGKTETFRAAGAPIPEGVLEADLSTLDAAIRATSPRRLLILGDLLHHPSGISGAMVDAVAAWRARHTMECVLVPGNHDRRAASLCEVWGMSIAPPVLCEAPFAFVHEPCHVDDHFTISGHVHPMVRLASRSDCVRLPCFLIREFGAILPAFSRFTRGVNVRPDPGDRVFATFEGQILEVSP